MGKVATEMQARLQAALAPDALELIDESHHHAGHAGHRGDDAESHFALSITSAAFVGKPRVARQRLVYAALGDLMAPTRVHALRIIATRAPNEPA